MKKTAIPFLVIFLLEMIVCILIIMFRTDSVLGLRIGSRKEDIEAEFQRRAIKKLEEGDKYLVYEKPPSSIEHIERVRLTFSDTNKLTKFEVGFAKRAVDIVDKGIEDELFYVKESGGKPDFELYYFIKNKLVGIYGEPNIESVNRERGRGFCKWHLKNVDVLFGIRGDICGLSCYSSQSVTKKIKMGTN